MARIFDNMDIINIITNTYSCGIKAVDTRYEIQYTLLGSTVQDSNTFTPELARVRCTCRQASPRLMVLLVDFLLFGFLIFILGVISNEISRSLPLSVDIKLMGLSSDFGWRWRVLDSQA